MAMSLPSALDHYAAQRRITRDGLLQARRLRFGALDRLAAAVEMAQLAAADESVSAVGAMLDEQNVTAPPVMDVATASVAGIASDGRSLVSLMGYLRSPDVDLARFDRAVTTQIRDAGRAASSLAIAARPKVTGYVRMLVPPSCSRCAILAGKEYRWNQGFQRHPNCFPAGVVVSGPASEKATRRWFQGELVVLATARGQELPVTGNHPVLTRRGWVPAHLLKEGDEVVRSTRPKGATALVVPHHDQVPSRIEDVWGALEVLGVDAVPSAAEDFHGDGQAGQVDVVGTDGPLVRDVLTSLIEPVREIDLAAALRSTLGFAGERSPEFVEIVHALAADSGVGGGGLSRALRGRHARGPYTSSLGSPANLNARFSQVLDEGGAGHAHLCGEGQDAFSVGVPGSDLVDGQVNGPLPRWDAPAGALSEENRGAYASRGADLLDRLSGQVELDRVVKVVRRHFAGHVYSLTSSEGWHVANNLIVSNCDCRHIPATERTARHLTTDPRAYFDSLDAAQQDRIFTKAGAQAIRDGADEAQVVNARRGMTTAQVGGERVLTTKAGATRGRIRLMPETIMQIAGGDRSKAIRLLRLHGYLRH